MEDIERKVAAEVLSELIENAPKKTSEEDINEMRQNGGIIDYFIGKNNGIQEFINCVNKLKEKYEKD